MHDSADVNLLHPLHTIRTSTSSLVRSFVTKITSPTTLSTTLRMPLPLRPPFPPGSGVVTPKHLPQWVLVELNRAHWHSSCAARLDGLDEGGIRFFPPTFQKQTVLGRKTRSVVTGYYNTPSQWRTTFTDYRFQGQTIPRAIAEFTFGDFWRKMIQTSRIKSNFTGFLPSVRMSRKGRRRWDLPARLQESSAVMVRSSD